VGGGGALRGGEGRGRGWQRRASRRGAAPPIVARPPLGLGWENESACRRSESSRISTPLRPGGRAGGRGGGGRRGGVWKGCAACSPAPGPAAARHARSAPQSATCRHVAARAPPAAAPRAAGHPVSRAGPVSGACRGRESPARVRTPRGRPTGRPAGLTIDAGRHCGTRGSQNRRARGGARGRLQLGFGRQAGRGAGRLLAAWRRSGATCGRVARPGGTWAQSGAGSPGCRSRGAGGRAGRPRARPPALPPRCPARPVPGPLRRVARGRGFTLTGAAEIAGPLRARGGAILRGRRRPRDRHRRARAAAAGAAGAGRGRIARLPCPRACG
jgi:hypothetical protein